MRNIDVSVVLNMHREALYLRPTLLSLEACALEAQKNGITVELIAVFDRSDKTTLEVFRTTNILGFSAIKLLEINVGSLGLARNAGIDLAEGEFVWTADGDDLVSSNAILELTNTARNHPHHDIVVFLEFLAAFGEQYHVVRYVGTEWLTAADFAFQHPFVSRIFVRRSVFDSLKYLDLKVTTGFAYEDWDFNCRIFAQGFDFKVAPDTVLFYRQRANSLLKQANTMSAKMIPHSHLFEPAIYQKKMAAAHDRVNDWSEFLCKRQQFFDKNFAHELLATKKLVNYVIDAALLDPEVELERIESASSYCPIPWDTKHWGFQLEILYKLLGSTPFDNVVLLPWLKPGGAEKYILQILNAIQEIRPKGRLLVISGEPAVKHEWVSKLPENSVFIDIYNAFPTLNNLDRDTLVVRALMAVSASNACLHIKASVFAFRLMDNFGTVISSKFKVIYYRFSDNTIRWRNTEYRGHWGISFLRRQLSNIDLLICDCEKIIKDDNMFLGATTEKYHTVYAACALPSSENLNREIKHRLLWASRISTEKRPELIGLIAKSLLKHLPNITIDVYGQLEANYNPKLLFDCPNICYHGGFDGFEILPTSNFDAFIYTSAFDGLPNIILEAIASGLPVVAPDIGGISEAVINHKTGYLVDNLADDTAMIEAYVTALRDLYANWNKSIEMAENGRRLISERHSKTAFNQRVTKAFQLENYCDLSVL